MRKQLLGVTLIALLSLVGCQSVKKLGGEPRSKVIRNCVSISPSTTELVAMMQIPLVGRSKADNYPASFKDTLVVADLKPDYEAITRLHPDAIVFDKALYGDAEIEKLKAVGSEIFTIDSQSIDEFIKDLFRLANKMGGEVNVNEYVEKIKKQRASALGDPFGHEFKAVVIIPDSSGHHMIAGSKSFQADLAKAMGVTPIGPDSNKFEMLNPEYLMSQNPDAIILAGKLDDFMKDTRFASLKAVKSQVIIGMNQDLIVRRGARVDQAIYEGHKALSLVTKGK